MNYQKTKVQNIVIGESAKICVGMGLMTSRNMVLPSDNIENACRQCN